MRLLRFNCWCILVLISALDLLVATDSGAAVSPSGLSQQAYVWQREWNAPVREAIVEHAGEFSGLVVLAAEVTWSGKNPKVVRVPVDYATLRAAGRRVGLALRIGSYAGRFELEGEPIESLARVAASLLERAKINELSVSELQIDFDCAESKLAGYRLWVDAIRRKISPMPLSITVLPVWLRQPGFRELASTAGTYVLQVHSLERPKSIGSSFSLCDPVAARQAVERAADCGVPFRVALPTYGYLMAFDRGGKFIGLSAEGPSRSWSADFQVREMRSQPDELAGLVRFWSTNQPPSLAGVIWYRLPTQADQLNWHWPTLAAVMKGRPPKGGWHARVQRQEPALFEISLVNDGETDLPLPASISLGWSDARLVAGDGLHGFELTSSTRTTAVLQQATTRFPSRLAPGQERLIGWVRLNKDQEVQIE